MSQDPPTRRRWLQFSVGTMFVVVTVVASLLASLASEVRFVKRRKDALTTVRLPIKRIDAVSPGPGYHRRPTIAIWRRWLGDEPVMTIVLEGVDSESPVVEYFAALFPEADIKGWVPGPGPFVKHARARRSAFSIEK